jgi:putative CocE/NonD family hydrolase
MKTVRLIMRIAEALVVRVTLATVLVVVAARAVRSDDGPFGVAVQTDVMVSMRHKVSLATDVYLPSRDGKPIAEKLPTILMRTPYNKSDAKQHGEYFAAHGYAFVAQDTRGRYRSEGVWHMLTDDGRDGYDTCNWIGSQPWSNGKLGTIGTSYVGGTQHALAVERPAELATAIPVDAMSNLGYASMRNGGAFELRFWNWIFSITRPGYGRHAPGDEGPPP